METSLKLKFALICATLTIVALIALAACDQGEEPTPTPEPTATTAPQLTATLVPERTATATARPEPSRNRHAGANSHRNRHGNAGAHRDAATHGHPRANGNADPGNRTHGNGYSGSNSQPHPRAAVRRAPGIRPKGGPGHPLQRSELLHPPQRGAAGQGRAQISLAVKAGSVHETDDQQGLAHFVEHMAFNGTERFAKQEIVEYLESIGSTFGPDLNARTGSDDTLYFFEIPTDDPEITETAFQILSDWAFSIAFDPEEVELERGVVLEEWRLSQGFDSRLQQNLLNLLFGDSLYASRAPIGLTEIIENAPVESLKAYYERWYRPDLMAVVAVGDFDVEDIEAKVKQYSAPPPEGEAGQKRARRRSDHRQAASRSPRPRDPAHRGLHRPRVACHPVRTHPQARPRNGPRSGRVPAHGSGEARVHDAEREAVRARPVRRTAIH